MLLRARRWFCIGHLPTLLLAFVSPSDRIVPFSLVHVRTEFRADSATQYLSRLWQVDRFLTSFSLGFLCLIELESPSVYSSRDYRVLSIDLLP